MCDNNYRRKRQLLSILYFIFFLSNLSNDVGCFHLVLIQLLCIKYANNLVNKTKRSCVWKNIYYLSRLSPFLMAAMNVSTKKKAFFFSIFFFLYFCWKYFTGGQCLNQVRCKVFFFYSMNQEDFVYQFSS